MYVCVCAAESVALAVIPVGTGSGESEMGMEDHEDESEMDEADDDELSAVLESVRDVLDATQVLLQRELDGKNLTRKLIGRWFLFHDADDSIQLQTQKIN